MSTVYQSPGDKMRYEILLKSMMEGRLNLAVLSDSDLTLDFYANQIHEDLRDRGERMVEFCFSADSIKLVEMFNGILSELTVSQARDKQVKSAPKRYLIFRDILAMQEFELQLLARLVNGFPASNINVVLMVNASAPYSSKLQTFGKNLLTWEVEPEPGQIKAETPEARGWTQRIPREPLVAPVPLAPAPSPDPPARPAAAAQAHPPEPVDLDHLSAKELSAGEAPMDPWEPEAKPPRKGLLVVLAVLLLSTLVFGYMYSDLLVQEYANLKRYLHLEAAPSSPASPASPVVASVGMATSVPASAINPTESLGEKEELIDGKAAAPVESAAAKASAVAAEKPINPPPAELAQSEAALASSKAQARNPVGTDQAAALTTGAAQDGANWARQLPEKSYVLQHAAFESLDEALAAQKRSPVLANAILLAAIKKNGVKYFVIVTGPYENRALAEAAMKSEAAFAKSWLRTAQSVKQQYAAL